MSVAGLFTQRQGEQEGAAACITLFETQLTPDGAGKVARKSEPQTDARFAAVLGFCGARERAEEVAAYFGGDSRAVVGKAYGQGAVYL